MGLEAAWRKLTECLASLFRRCGSEDRTRYQALAPSAPHAPPASSAGSQGPPAPPKPADAAHLPRDFDLTTAIAGWQRDDSFNEAKKFFARTVTATAGCECFDTAGREAADDAELPEHMRSYISAHAIVLRFPAEIFANNDGQWCTPIFSACDKLWRIRVASPCAGLDARYFCLFPHGHRERLRCSLVFAKRAGEGYKECIVNWPKDLEGHPWGPTVSGDELAQYKQSDGSLIMIVHAGHSEHACPCVARLWCNTSSPTAPCAFPSSRSSVSSDITDYTDASSVPE